MSTLKISKYWASSHLGRQFGNLHKLKCRSFSSSIATAPKNDDPKLWVHSPKPDIKPFLNITTPEFIFQNLGHWENATAFECGMTGRKYTHLQVYSLSRSFGAALMNAGFKKNDVLSTFLPNMPEFSIVLAGAWQAGLTITLGNPLYTPVEIGHQLQHCLAKCVVTIPLLLPVLLKAKELHPKELSSLQIIVIGEPQENCHTFSEMLKTSAKGVKFVVGTDANVNTQEDLAMLPYSSGTTGPPKAVMLTHYGLVNNICQLEASGVARKFLGGNEQEKALGLLPFFHVFGLQALAMCTLYYGAHTVVLPKFEPNLFIQTLKQHKFTLMHLVTPLIAFMVNHPEIGPEELSKVHAIIGGAAPIGQALISRMLDKAGHYVCFQECYGMTELSPASHCVLAETRNSKVGSMGAPVASTTCRIVDVESGNTVGAHQKGELHIKGPQVMKGYYKNEEATRATIDSQGWLHTGDIAYYDDDGYFFIVDRMKELIKVKAMQVAPSELENLLRKHPGVADCAVIGVPHEESGELPRAYIVRSTDSLTEEAVHEFIKDKVAPFKYLKGGIAFLETIPKAPSGKILRRILKEDYLKSV